MRWNRRKTHLVKIDCPNITFQMFTIQSLYILYRNITKCSIQEEQSLFLLDTYTVKMNCYFVIGVSMLY